MRAMSRCWILLETLQVPKDGNSVLGGLPTCSGPCSGPRRPLAEKQGHQAGT